MLFQIDHRSSRLAALLSELFCLLSLPLVLALISLQQLQYDSLIHILPNKQRTSQETERFAAVLR